MTTVQLLIIQGRPAGKRLLFPAGDYYIGRGDECHIRPDSEWVSRQHCLLRVADEGVFLRDLGSRNGTLVNGRLVAGELRLGEGDRIQVGPLVFEVRWESTEAPATAVAEEGIETAPAAPERPEAPAPVPAPDRKVAPSPPA